MTCCPDFAARNAWNVARLEGLFALVADLSAAFACTVCQLCMWNLIALGSPGLTLDCLYSRGIHPEHPLTRFASPYFWKLWLFTARMSLSPLSKPQGASMDISHELREGLTSEPVV